MEKQKQVTLSVVLNEGWTIMEKQKQVTLSVVLNEGLFNRINNLHEKMMENAGYISRSRLLRTIIDRGLQEIVKDNLYKTGNI